MPVKLRMIAILTIILFLIDEKACSQRPPWFVPHPDRPVRVQLGQNYREFLDVITAADKQSFFLVRLAGD
jgi:hypothetical protein